MKLSVCIAAAALAWALPTLAQTPAAAPAATASAAPMVDGEVRKVDRAQARLTLRHGPIPSLDMAPMTMVFRVADPAMLEGLKEGDKVRFGADRVNGLITVTAIERAR
ncbi:MAG: copper-binding protein [Ideonella sp.]|nr:copper-binding protein [Ideonella sp.]